MSIIASALRYRFPMLAPSLPERYRQCWLALRPPPSPLRIAHRDQRDVGILGRDPGLRIDLVPEHRMQSRDRSAEAVTSRGQAQVLDRREDRAMHRLSGARPIRVALHTREDEHRRLADVFSEILRRAQDAAARTSRVILDDRARRRREVALPRLAIPDRDELFHLRFADHDEDPRLPIAAAGPHRCRLDHLDDEIGWDRIGFQTAHRARGVDGLEEIEIMMTVHARDCSSFGNGLAELAASR